MMGRYLSGKTSLGTSYWHRFSYYRIATQTCFITRWVQKEISSSLVVVLTLTLGEYITGAALKPKRQKIFDPSLARTENASLR